MSATQTREAQEWIALANLDEESRIQKMAERFDELAKRDEAARMSSIREIVGATFDQDDATLRMMTKSRLLSWLRMDEHDAHVVGVDFERAANELDADQAFRRVSILQLVKGDIHLEDQARIRHIVPSAMGDAPPIEDEAVPVAVGADGHSMDENDEKKPWWKFWA